MSIAAQVAFTTPYRTAPYLTIAEYKTAPTAVDVSNLVPGAPPATQDSELANVISRASGWVDNLASQILAATVNTEARRLRTRRDGTLVVHPDSWPILEVRDLQYGSSPAGLTQLSDLSGLWIEEQQFVVTFAGVQAVTSVGPLQLGGLGPGEPLLVRYTYVNGWPNTTLQSAAAAAATSIVVADTTGIYAGTRLVLDSGSVEEQVTVQTTPTTTTVALAAPLASGHQAGVSATALPPQVKEATILLCSALIKTRGTEALVMPGIGGMSELHVAATTPGSSQDVADATALIRPFSRVR
jgi:hypothetical protein